VSNTPKAGLTELSSSTANQAVVVNVGGYAIIDQLLVPVVVDKDLTAAPGSPADGDMYIMASAWSGVANAAAGRLVFWRSSSNSWSVIIPRVGWRVAVADELDANSAPKMYSCTASGATSTWSLPESGLTNPMISPGDIIYGGSAGIPTRLGISTDGYVLTLSSGLPAWAAPTGGGGVGLTNWVDALSTSSPNATVPVASLTVTGVATNIDAVIAAKGTGATLAQIPDASAAGGNKRGASATDLQKVRSAAAQVATGTASVIGGGGNNTVVGDYSGILSGFGSSIPTSSLYRYSVICGGNGNSISAQYGFIGGGNGNSVTGDYASVLGGNSNVASGVYSSVTGGWGAGTRGVHGAEARASGIFSTTGDAQRSRHTLRRATSSATPDVLSSSGTTAVATNQVILPDNSAYAVSGRVVARSSAGDVAAWDFKGLIKRGSGAATTSLVGTITPISIAADSGASSWAITVTANTTLGCLTVGCTGAASTSIKWVADIETVEVVG